MAGPTGLKVAKLRYEGYCKAHQEAGLNIDQSLILNYAFDFENGYRVLLNFLNCTQGIDAVFAINDRVAIEALAAVRDAGKRVPEDISVMGFNNEGFSSFLYPSLTTVLQPSYEMGKKAAQLQMDIIEKKEPEKNEYIFDTEIIKRKSTIIR